MTAHSPVINELVALVVPLLVKDKQHTIQTAYSIVKDLDLDKCSKHKMEALDFGLFDLMRVIYSKLQFYSVMYCNCTNRLSLLGFCEDMSTSNPVCR